MKPRFIVVKPKHWYQWINPFWWRNQRKIEKFLNWVAYENNIPKKCEDAYIDMLTYGYSVIDINDEVTNEK